MDLNPREPDADRERPRPRRAPQRYLLRVWTDAGGFHATVQGGGEPATFFCEPDDVLLFLYHRLLRPGPPRP